MPISSSPHSRCLTASVNFFSLGIVLSTSSDEATKCHQAHTASPARSRQLRLLDFHLPPSTSHLPPFYNFFNTEVVVHLYHIYLQWCNLALSTSQQISSCLLYAIPNISPIERRARDSQLHPQLPHLPPRGFPIRLMIFVKTRTLSNPRSRPYRQCFQSSPVHGAGRCSC